LSGQKDFASLTVDTDGPVGNKTSTIVATAAHPFWVPGNGRWLDAGDLRPGDDLRTANGTHAEVQAVGPTRQHRTVYNLTVADIHTYHVAAGDVTVLVHNQQVGACPVNGLPHGKLGEAATLR
jgi:hypothetical protein